MCSMASWNRLPLDCQHLVLTQLVGSISSQDEPSPSRLAHYAAVGKFWQSFFERRTFRHLFLDPADIPYFDRIVHSGRRKYVTHILLHLPARGPLDHRGSSRHSSLSNDERNDVDFTRAVWGLLLALSKWDIQGPDGNRGVTIELGAYMSSLKGDESSQKSTQLYSRYLTNGHAASYGVSLDPVLRPLLSSDLVPPTEPSFLDILSMAVLAPIGLCSLSLNFSEFPPEAEPTLPQAKVVTGILIRRCYLLNFDPEALNKIFGSLPRLETIHLERWRFAKNDRDVKWDQRAKVLCFALPPSLNRLTIYEEANTSLRRYSSCRIKAYPRELVNSVFIASQRLKQMAVSSLIDAEDFFRPFFPLETQSCPQTAVPVTEWASLSSIASTAVTLTSRSYSSVNRLLLAAASAARRMPELEVLELWNQDRTHVGIFRYQKLADVCKLTWQGTWDLPIDTKVLDAWEAVASRATESENGLKFMVEKRVIESMADEDIVFDYLVLKDLILHDVSRVQIRQQYCAM